MALKENKITLIMNKKFGEIIFDSPKFNQGGVILITDIESDRKKFDLIKEILNNHIDKMYNNYYIYQRKIRPTKSLHIH